MRDELFGPIVTAYVYPEGEWEETLELVDDDGAVRADRRGLLRASARPSIEAEEALRYAAGNFYVNDKPTGAVVGQQPFGGARASGTNDKAGSMWNLIRWVSPRTIKETFIPPTRLPLPLPRRRRRRVAAERRNLAPPAHPLPARSGPRVHRACPKPPP